MWHRLETWLRSKNQLRLLSEVENNLVAAHRAMQRLGPMNNSPHDLTHFHLRQELLACMATLTRYRAVRGDIEPGRVTAETKQMQMRSIV